MCKILFIFLFLMSNPAFAETPLICDIEIEFNSEGSGIDASVYSKVMDRIIETPAITEKHAENVGAGGERTLCLKVEENQIDVVYDDLKTLIPEESKTTWTRITSRTGRGFKTQPLSVFTRNPAIN